MSACGHPTPRGRERCARCSREYAAARLEAVRGVMARAGLCVTASGVRARAGVEMAGRTLAALCRKGEVVALGGGRYCPRAWLP